MPRSRITKGFTSNRLVTPILTYVLRKGEIMTGQQAAELARTRQPLPEGERLSVIMLYYSVRGIYRSYEAKELTLEQAKRAKQDALREYDSLALSERCHIEDARRWSEICRVLNKAEKCGCEYCKEVVRIFDGRQRMSKLA